MLTVAQTEALKVVNAYEIKDVQEAQAFVAVHSECMEGKTVDEMIASYQKTLDILLEVEMLEHTGKIKEHIAKFHKCKDILGL